MCSGEKKRAQPAEGVKGIGWRTRFLSNGTQVCASGGSGGGYLIFYKPTEDKPYHKLKLKDTARDMDLHPDGRLEPNARRAAGTAFYQ